MSMYFSTLVLLLVLTVYTGAQTIRITQHPANDTYCEGSNAVLSCVIFDNTTNNVSDNTGWFYDEVIPVDASMISNSRDRDVVTSILTIESVSLNDNGDEYFCGPSRDIDSYVGVISVAAKPTKPTVTPPTPLNSTSFMIEWISNASFNYTVILTNLNSLTMDSFPVPENTNSYTVAGLSDNANYNVSVAAENMCGKERSKNMTVYAPPNQPNFTQCVSYKNGEPALKVLSFVTVNAPKMSSRLTFSASYQTGNSSNSNSQLVECAMQSNCTAEFFVDITPPVNVIKSVEVTVNGTYGSNTSEPMKDIDVREIIAVSATFNSTSATLECELPCFSNLSCSLFSIIPNEVMIVNGTIMGSLMSYSYPTQQIMISNLTENTTYRYCVVAINMTNMMKVGEVCGNFSTAPTGGDESGGNGTGPSGTSSKGSNAAAIGGGVAGGVVAVIAVGIGIFVVYMLCCRNKDRDDSDKQELRSPTTTSGSHTASVQPASNVQPTSSVPHQAAASGEEYALTSKVVTKPQQQQPPEEYAMVDKTKRHAAAAQGIHYADLQALPSSGDKPPPNQGPSTYAMVA